MFTRIKTYLRPVSDSSCTESPTVTCETIFLPSLCAFSHFVEIKPLNQLILRKTFPRCTVGSKVLLGFLAAGGWRLDLAGSLTRLRSNLGGNAVSARNKK